MFLFCKQKKNYYQKLLDLLFCHNKILIDIFLLSEIKLILLTSKQLKRYYRKLNLIKNLIII